MKIEKLLATVFIIATSSLFASQLEKTNFNIDKTYPIETALLETNKNPDNYNVSIKSYENNEKLNNLNYNNKVLLFKEIQLEAVKNYTYIMPDIIGKE